MGFVMRQHHTEMPRGIAVRRLAKPNSVSRRSLRSVRDPEEKPAAFQWYCTVRCSYIAPLAQWYLPFGKWYCTVRCSYIVPIGTVVFAVWQVVLHRAAQLYCVFGTVIFAVRQVVLHRAAQLYCAFGTVIFAVRQVVLHRAVQLYCAYRHGGICLAGKRCCAFAERAEAVVREKIFKQGDMVKNGIKNNKKLSKFKNFY